MSFLTCGGPHHQHHNIQHVALAFLEWHTIALAVCILMDADALIVDDAVAVLHHLAVDQGMTPYQAATRIVVESP